MKKSLCLLFIIIFSQSTRAITQEQAPASDTYYSFSPTGGCPELHLWYDNKDYGAIDGNKTFWLKQGLGFGLAGDGFRYDGTLGNQADFRIQCTTYGGKKITVK